MLSSSAVASFPLSLEFKFRAQSSAEINFVALHYQVERLNYARVTSEVRPRFKPGPAVEATWRWDMRLGSLPPGARVKYWWTVGDASGRKLVTEAKTFEFNDERYKWKSVTAGSVTLSWYEGDEAFARELLNSVQASLDRLGRDMGAKLERPVRAFIYASGRDLQGALVYPVGWEGGVAVSEFGTVMIGISTSELAWGKRAIAHEITHLLVGQVTFSPYADLPIWLNEGLAMYGEGPLEQGYASLLQQAISQKTLISVRSLSAPFSTDPRLALLSYAQSEALVEFLLTKYGRDKLLALLDTFKQGATFDGALKSVYGFDLDGLDKLWRESLETRKTTASLPLRPRANELAQRPVPAAPAAAWGFLVFPVVLAFGYSVRRRW
ncbi:MAG: peptidase MA family metallohydrolase [Dehalococcoidia bacterium]|nr:peptidase MA family metallohydrolase [Dehalococcoidia bacterium]